MSRSELLEKLGKIAELYENTQAIQAEMDDYEPEDTYERTVTVPQFPGKFQDETEREIWEDRLDHGEENALEVAELAHRDVYAPKEPPKPKKQEFREPDDSELRNQESKFGCLSKVLAGVAVFFFLGILLNLNDEYSVLPTLIVIALVAAAGFLFFRFKANGAKAAQEKKKAEALQVYNQQQEDRMAEYAKQMKSYEGEYARYEELLHAFMEDYRAWREIYLQSVEEEAQIAQKLDADREAAVEKIYAQQYAPAEKALTEYNDLVPEEYLPALDVLMELIRSNRADDLKEAINLYEEILYRERQLQLQREMEAQRQYEEQLKREAEERHHQEQMELQREQEYQRQREEERRRSDEERRYREETRAREAEARSREYQERERQRKAQLEEARKEREAREKLERAASAQCRACAHAGHCNMMIHNKTPNCTGFTPRR